MLKEVFVFPLPPTGNQIIRKSRNNRYAAGKNKKDWEQWLSGLIVGKQKFPGEIYLEYHWHLDRFNQRDPDNVAFGCKYIHDALVVCEIFVDDSLKYIKAYNHHFHEVKRVKGQKNNPHVELICCDYPHLGGKPLGEPPSEP